MKFSTLLLGFGLLSAMAQARSVRVEVDAADFYLKRVSLIDLVLELDNGRVITPAVLTQAEIASGLTHKDIQIGDAVVIRTCSARWAGPTHVLNAVVQRGLLPEDGVLMVPCDLSRAKAILNPGFSMQSWGVRVSAEALTVHGANAVAVIWTHPSAESSNTVLIRAGQESAFHTIFASELPELNLPLKWFLKNGSQATGSVKIYPGQTADIP